LTANANLIAQGEAIATSTAAGTSSGWALQRFGHFTGRSSATAPVSADIQYANNLDGIESIRSDCRIDGADPLIAALTGKMEMRFADQMCTVTLVTDIAAY
jgi:hypothetical protein